MCFSAQHSTKMLRSSEFSTVRQKRSPNTLPQKCRGQVARLFSAGHSGTCADYITDRRQQRDAQWKNLWLSTLCTLSELLECRERLESAHTQMQEAMTELITNKNFSEAERLLHAVDKLMPI
jgi:hypothetical protein